MHGDDFDPVALPRVLTRSDAVRVGFTDQAILHRVRTGRWTRILPHTYLTSDTLTWPDRLAAAVAFAGPGGLLSGAAALCDRGLTSVRRPARLLVLAPAGGGPHSTGWVRVRRSDRPVERAVLPGPPRATDARSVADLAVELRYVDDVRALVAETVRKGLCTPEELTDQLTCGPRKGSAHLRQAIDEISAGAWSAPEASAATLLRRAGVPPFEQNAPILLPDGRVFIADFLWRELRAILEIDSYAHHSLPADADGTSARHLILETLDFSVVHRSPRFLREHPERFVYEISSWLAGRAAHLGR